MEKWRKLSQNYHQILLLNKSWFLFIQVISMVHQDHPRIHRVRSPGEQAPWVASCQGHTHPRKVRGGETAATQMPLQSLRGCRRKSCQHLRLGEYPCRSRKVPAVWGLFRPTGKWHSQRMVILISLSEFLKTS